jgi:hypothetical protein
MKRPAFPRGSVSWLTKNPLIALIVSFAQLRVEMPDLERGFRPRVVVRLFRDKRRPARCVGDRMEPGARGPVEGGGGDGRDQTEVTTLMSRACGPFGPSSTSHSTFAPSARLLKPPPRGRLDQVAGAC